MAKNGIKNQPKATAAAKKSAKSGKFETNIKSKQWRVVSPEGKVYQITNLYNWVRENENLFNPKDAEWKRQGGKRGTGGEYCNATAGLSNVKGGKSKAWKGWTLEIDPN